MPVFNAADYLAETLESIAKQQYTNWELLAVDDGSTDSSRQLLEAFRARFPDRVQILSSPHLGPSAARNHGAEGSRGTWIALCDADDVWQPSKLSRQLDFLEGSEQMIACTCPYFLGTGATDPVIGFDWSPQAMTAWALLEGFGPALCSTILVKTSIYRELGGFDTNMRVAEDTEFALRLSRAGFVGTLEAPLVSYRRSSPGKYAFRISSTIQGIERLRKDPMFASDSRLSKRLCSNLNTLIAMRLVLQKEFLSALGYLAKALLQSPTRPVAYLVISVRRRLRGQGA